MQKLVADIIKLKVAALRYDLEARKIYCNRIFYLVCWCLGGFFLLVVLDGAGWLNVPEVVLKIIAYTTTVSIVGLLVFIIKYLFPGKK